MRDASRRGEEHLRACVAIGLQSVEGLESLYGAKEALELLSQTANKIILRCDSPRTAEWASAVFGRCETRSRQLSRSYGTGGRGGEASRNRSAAESIRLRDVVPAGEILDLPLASFDEGLTAFSHLPMLGNLRLHFKGRELREGIVPACDDTAAFMAAEIPGRLPLCNEKVMPEGRKGRLIWEISR